jgi:hypothetical protein
MYVKAIEGLWQDQGFVPVSDLHYEDSSAAHKALGTSSNKKTTATVLAHSALNGIGGRVGPVEERDPW